ncbi:MAG: hypothetical protein WCA81_11870 [Rhizomicrobium sp.]
MSDAREDISYMRQLAEQGRRGPIVGGTFFVAAGIVFGAACLADGAARAGLLPISGWEFLYLWLGAFAVFGLVWRALYFRLRSFPGKATSGSNAAFGIAWSACAVGVFVALAAVEIVAAVINAPIVLNAYIPMIFVLYGIAWFTTAAIARRHWMFAAAAGSFAFSLIMAALAENKLQVAVMGLALLLLLTLPGLLLMKEETR